MQSILLAASEGIAITPEYQANKIRIEANGRQ